MIEGCPVIDIRHHVRCGRLCAAPHLQADGARRLVNDRISLLRADDLHRVAPHLAADGRSGSRYGSGRARRLCELVRPVAHLSPSWADLPKGWRAASAGGTARALLPALRG
jgi:hypothetical protein